MILIHSTEPAVGQQSGVFRRTASRAWRGVLAGLAASLLLGAVARVLMRLAMLATDRDPAFTWAGSLGIGLGWAMFTLPGALLAALYLGRGRSLGLVVGGCLLAYFTTQVARSDLGQLEVLSRAQLIGALAAAAGIFLTALAIPMVTLRLLRKLRVSGRAVAAKPEGAAARPGTARARRRERAADQVPEAM